MAIPKMGDEAATYVPKLVVRRILIDLIAVNRIKGIPVQIGNGEKTIFLINGLPQHIEISFR